MIYRTLFLAAFCALLVIVSLGLGAKFYLQSRANLSQSNLPTAPTNDSEVGPTNTTDDQVRSLRDQLDQTQTRLANAIAAQNAPKEIDKKNPALALFSPVVTDRSADQNLVLIENFRFAKANGKSPAMLTFDLKNAHPGETTEKGYIVVLARGENGLLAYPNVFNPTGPYLLDFEKGETFQVARFRLVNATFDMNSDRFQIFIFTRKGELLINRTHEVSSAAH